MLCDDLEEWDVGMQRRLRKEGVYAYLQLIHIVLQQKLTQLFKAIIFQLKKICVQDFEEESENQNTLIRDHWPCTSCNRRGAKI